MEASVLSEIDIYRRVNDINERMFVARGGKFPDHLDQTEWEKVEPGPTERAALAAFEEEIRHDIATRGFSWQKIEIRQRPGA
jgi:hypothetical protein